MGPSLRDYHSSFVRPVTRHRPQTRDQNVDQSLVIPSRTSSLHSRITQPIPSTLNIKPTQRTPKTLTHAYMVCGVGREPSQWVKAPAPAQGKIAHMKGAVGQFWLPEILGSSPRLEQDNEIARALHAAMRVSLPMNPDTTLDETPTDCDRLASLTTSRYARAGVNPTVCSTLSFSSKIHHTRCTELHCEYGLVQTKNGPKQFASYGNEPKLITTTRLTRRIGSHTA